jgi:NAD(P)H-quinone oxidoreductase subunit 5
MLLELGLGLFVLAVLHLVAHSLYKAHAFLSSGSMVDVLRAPSSRKKQPVTAQTWAAAVALSALITFAMAAAWGITPASEPSLLAIGTIVAVAVSQLLLAAWSGRALAVRVVGVTVLVTAVYFALHAGVSVLFGGTLRPIPHDVPAGHYLLLALIALVFLGLSYFQSVLTSQAASPRLRRLYVHLYNGLYTDLPVERLVYRVWPARFRDLPGRRGRLRS